MCQNDKWDQRDKCVQGGGNNSRQKIQLKKKLLNQVGGSLLDPAGLAVFLIWPCPPRLELAYVQHCSV